MQARCPRALPKKFVHLAAGSRQSFVLTMTLCALLAACGGTTIIEKPDAEPHARHEGGASLFVEAIEADDNLITLDLLIINGTNDRIEVVDDNDPMVLQDKSGKQYVSGTEEVALEPYTSNKLRISFAGPLADDKQSLTLRTNPKYGNQFSAPQLVVGNIPVSDGGRIEFAKFKTFQIGLPDMTFHHANGLTFTLKEIAAEGNEVRITFNAVNGHENDVKLAGASSDRAFVQDEQGNRLYLVPASTNRELSIPAGQKLSGTLRFAGRMGPTTKTLNLNFNNKFGSAADFSNSPKIVINSIPIQGVTE